MNKKIKIVLVLLTIITVFTIGCGSSVKKSDGYYNGIKWGSTIADVEQKLGDDIVVADDKASILQIIENFEEINGSQAWVMYFFENDRLCKISITPSVLPNNTTLSDDGLNSQLYDRLVEKYGECSDSDSLEKTWNTKNSVITMSASNYIEYVPNE